MRLPTWTTFPGVKTRQVGASRAAGEEEKKEGGEDGSGNSSGSDSGR